MSNKQKLVVVSAVIFGIGSLTIAALWMNGFSSEDKSDDSPILMAKDDAEGAKSTHFVELFEKEPTTAINFNQLPTEQKLTKAEENDELVKIFLTTEKLEFPTEINQKIAEKIKKENDKIQNNPNLSQEIKEGAKAKAEKLLETPLIQATSPNDNFHKENRPYSEPVQPPIHSPPLIGKDIEAKELSNILNAATFDSKQCSKIWDKFDFVTTKVNTAAGVPFTAVDLVAKCNAALDADVKAIASSINELIALKTPNDISSLKTLETKLEKVSKGVKAEHPKVQTLPGFAEIAAITDLKKYLAGKLEPGTDALKDDALLTRCILLKELRPHSDVALFKGLMLLTPQQLPEIHGFEKLLKDNDKKITLPSGKTIQGIIDAAKAVPATDDIGVLLLNNNFGKIQSLLNAKDSAHRVKELTERPELINAVLLSKIKVDANEFVKVDGVKVTAAIKDIKDAQKKPKAEKEYKRLQLQALLNSTPQVSASIIPFLDIIDDGEIVLTKKSDPSRKWTKDEILLICFPKTKKAVDDFNSAFKEIEAKNAIDFSILETLYESAKSTFATDNTVSKKFLDSKFNFDKTTVYAGFSDELFGLAERLVASKKFALAWKIVDKIRAVDQAKYKAWLIAVAADKSKATVNYYASKRIFLEEMKANASIPPKMEDAVKKLIALRTSFAKTDEETAEMNPSGGKSISDTIREYVRDFTKTAAPPSRSSTAIACTKPRGIINSGSECTVISVYQALANFFPLIKPVNLKPDAPPDVKGFVSIMNGLLTPSTSPLDISAFVSAVKCSGDSQKFFGSLLESLKGAPAIASGLDMNNLISIHYSDSDALGDYIFPSELIDPSSSVGQKAITASKAPVLVLFFTYPIDVSKTVHLPSFPPKGGPLEKYDTFQLHALICNTNGHEVAFTKRADNQWYLLDDDKKVSAISEGDLPLSKLQQQDTDVLLTRFNYPQARVSIAFYLRTGLNESV